MEKIQLNKKQAQKFAYAIFADIASYIETHREEYEEFLRSEAKLTQRGGEKNGE